MRVVLLCGQQIGLAITKSARSFQSYANEMCGQLGLASNTLRFQMEKRDVQPSKIMTHTCLIKVSHTYDFHQSPNKSLRPALESILDKGAYTDFEIVVNDSDTFKVHRCIMAVRSAPLAALLRKDHTVQQIKVQID